MTINGSSRPNHNNGKLLRAIGRRYSSYRFDHLDDLSKLPLYLADQENKRHNETVSDFKQRIMKAEAVIISTPEYIHGLPAILKNALEWTTQTGEFNNKRVLAMTYSPHPPRGHYSMTSLKNVLQALGSNVIGAIDLYQNQLTVDSANNLVSPNGLDLIDLAIKELM